MPVCENNGDTFEARESPLYMGKTRLLRQADAAIHRKALIAQMHTISTFLRSCTPREKCACGELCSR